MRFPQLVVGPCRGARHDLIEWLCARQSGASLHLDLSSPTPVLHGGNFRLGTCRLSLRARVLVTALAWSGTTGHGCTTMLLSSCHRHGSGCGWTWSATIMLCSRLSVRTAGKALPSSSVRRCLLRPPSSARLGQPSTRRSCWKQATCR